MAKRFPVRINLHVYVREEDGCLGYCVIHLGFFPQRVAGAVAASVNAASIAFGRCAGEIGKIDVVPAFSVDGESWDDSAPSRTVTYGVRRDSATAPQS
jgi:hypothetical protein